MARHPLDPAFAKIDRAEAHIKELNTAVGEFLRTNPYRIESKPNRKGDRDIWSIVPDDIPLPLENIAADAVHNVRTPLDKMLSVRDSIHTRDAVIGSIKFPFGDDLDKFEYALAGQKKHLSGPVIEFLEAAESYPGGRGAHLWLVNKLDNRDKHRTLLQPVKLQLTGRQLNSIKSYRGTIFTIGSRRGKHMVRGDDGNMYQPDPALRPPYRVRPPLMTGYVEFTSAHDDMEIATSELGAEVEINVEIPMSIAFSEVGAFEGEPVVELIEAMREAVKATLVTFRDRFF